MIERITVDIPDFIGPFPAVTDGTSWNGWECPHFTFDVACDVAAALIAQGQVAGYDEATDRFFAILSEPVDGLEALNNATDRTEFDWQAYGGAMTDEALQATRDNELSPGIHVDWYGPAAMDGQKVYGVGAFGWCWEEMA